MHSERVSTGSPPQPTPALALPSPPTLPATQLRRRAPASSVRLHIARLVLDGIELDGRDERSFEEATTAELTFLLAHVPVSGRLGSGGMAYRLPGPEAELGPWSGPEDLGRQLARAVHRSLGR